MDALIVAPSRKYLTKAYLIIAIMAGGVVLGALLIAAFVGLGPEVGVEAIRSLAISLVINVLWVVPAVLLIGPYYRSLRYEIHEEQVVMHVGIITRSVKCVPFGTVTNMTVIWDPLDRAFGIGSLEIQTAGIGSTAQAEQNLVGLEDPEAVSRLAVQALR